MISKNGLLTSAKYPELPIIFDRAGNPEDPMTYLTLARRVIDRALFDLSSDNARHRDEAIFFFEDPATKLGFWCDLAYFELSDLLRFYRRSKHLLKEHKTTRGEMYAHIINQGWIK